jgi:hypothetical protein
VVKGCIDDYDTLIDLFESIEHFLNRLEIYTKIDPSTDAMTEMSEMIVKLLVELLSTLALATKQIKEGKSSESTFVEVLFCLTVQRRKTR